MESLGIPEGWAGQGPLGINTPGGENCTVSHTVIPPGRARDGLQHLCLVLEPDLLATTQA